MKKILLILFLFLSLYVRSQINTAWFNSYPAKELPTITLTTAYATTYNLRVDYNAFAGIPASDSIIIFASPYSPGYKYRWSDTRFGVQSSYNGYFSEQSGQGINIIALIKSGNDSIWSNKLQIYVDEVDLPPTVVTNSVIDITPTTANVNGTISDNGGQTVISYGAQYRRVDNPAWSVVMYSGAPTTFQANLTNLSTGYYYLTKAFATNGVGTGFGQEIQFLTTSIPGDIPTVTTNSITNITASSAVSGGNVTSQGSSAVTQRGVQWSSTSDFASILGSTMDGAGIGSYSSNITGLTYSTSYYVRAYATNSSGTSYGSVLNFITSPCPPPSVETFSASNITSSSFTLYAGNISLCGSQSITSHTIMFSTDSGFSTSQYIDVSSTSTDNYSVSYSNGGGITILPNTTYYYRARIVVNSTIYYGNTLSLTTCSLPTIAFYSCSNATVSSVQVSAYINSDGGCPVTSRGFDYCTDGSFTTILGSVTVGSGIGSYDTIITGLQCNTRYYFRPWVTNSVGTCFGVNCTDNTGTDCTTSSCP